MNKQKNAQKAGWELRDVFERVIDRIDLGETLQRVVIECTLDVLGDVVKVLLRDWVAIKRTKRGLRPGSRL